MNAYAESVVSLDLDLVVATDQRASVERVLDGGVRGSAVSVPA